jgi:hypothetical protein
MRGSSILQIRVKEATPRVKYTFKVIFEHIINVEYCLLPSGCSAEELRLPCLMYTPHHEENTAPWIPASSLLFEEGINSQLKPACTSWFNKKLLFAHEHTEATLPFDLPAMVFFLVSRYEEYQDFTPDHLGRFPARESLAYKEGFLHQPLINYWVMQLAKRLKSQFPELKMVYPAYRLRTSFDVDLAWAYKYRPVWLTVAGGLRDLLQRKWGLLSDRMMVLAGKRQDPFYCFDYLVRWSERYPTEAIFFFLLGDYGAYDKNTSYKQQALQQLIQQLASKFTIGIHPSFRSNKVAGQLQQEISRLEAIKGGTVKHSRQHFLMLRFPDTYRKLLAQGITHDYSMGFAQEVGFRASIASPFPWYDILLEKETDLMVHPFAAMDVSLKQYLGLSPQEALEILKEISQEVRAVNGELMLLWHNSSFSGQHGWEGWPEVFEKVLSFASEKQ